MKKNDIIELSINSDEFAWDVISDSTSLLKLESSFGNKLKLKLDKDTKNNDFLIFDGLRIIKKKDNASFEKISIKSYFSSKNKKIPIK